MQDDDGVMQRTCLTLMEIGPTASRVIRIQHSTRSKGGHDMREVSRVAWGHEAMRRLHDEDGLQSPHGSRRMMIIEPEHHEGYGFKEQN
jgi:hypothetical protein